MLSYQDGFMAEGRERRVSVYDGNAFVAKHSPQVASAGKEERDRILRARAIVRIIASRAALNVAYVAQKQAGK